MKAFAIAEQKSPLQIIESGKKHPFLWAMTKIRLGTPIAGVIPTVLIDVVCPTSTCSFILPDPARWCNLSVGV
jgi:hypothetical protein